MEQDRRLLSLIEQLLELSLDDVRSRSRFRRELSERLDDLEASLKATSQPNGHDTTAALSIPINASTFSKLWNFGKWLLVPLTAVAHWFIVHFHYYK